jgi:hypothetical protein
MNNGAEGKNTQEICIDEEKTMTPPLLLLLASRKEKKERTRSVDIQKTCLTVVVVFFRLFFSFFSLCTIRNALILCRR